MYAAIVPLGQSPDEPAHYMYLEELAKRYFPSVKTDALYQSRSSISGRPPLYYLLGVPVFVIIPETVPGRAMVVRLISVSLYVLVVYLVYMLAASTFPQNPAVHWGAPMLVTLQPMVGHIFSSINADVLTAVSLSFFLLAGHQLLKKGITWQRVCLLAAASIGGMLTRQTLLGVVPLSLVLLASLLIFRAPAEKRRDTLRRIALLAVILAIFVLAISLLFGIWQQTYSHLNLLVQRQKLQVVLTSADVVSHTTFFFDSIWGVFGALLSARLPQLYFDWLWMATKLSAAGLILLAFLQVVNKKKRPLDRAQVLTLIMMALPPLLFFVVSILESVPSGGTSPPQGRYAFPAIASLSVLFVLGLSLLVELPTRFLRKVADLAVMHSASSETTVQRASKQDNVRSFTITFAPASLESKLTLVFLLALLFMAVRVDLTAIFQVLIPHYYGSVANFLSPATVATLGSHPNLSIDSARQILLASRIFPFNNGTFYACLFYAYYLFVGLTAYALYLGRRVLSVT